MHAYTNSAPSAEVHEWHSEDCDNSMIITRKPYSEEARIINKENYMSRPKDHQGVNNVMKNYKACKENLKSKQKVEEEKIKEERELRRETECRKTNTIKLFEKAVGANNKALNKVKKTFSN